MAFSYGRQFRRIAAQALTADPDEMRALIARILPARDDGAPAKLRVRSEADRQRAPAVIVFAFFADALTGDEAADLLRQTENPAFRKQAQHDGEDDTYARFGPISLTPGWRAARGLPPADPAPDVFDPTWGPPIFSVDRAEADRPRGGAANAAGELVKNNENTSAACCDAADHAPQRPP
jgi:hypothetical protein